MGTSPINSFCPLDTTLVLTSVISIQFSLHPFHSSLLPVPSLVAFIEKYHTMFSLVCSHTFILFWLRKTSMSVKIFQLCSMGLFVPVIWRPLNFFPFYLYFCVIHTSVLSPSTWSLSLIIFESMNFSSFKYSCPQLSKYSNTRYHWQQIIWNTDILRGDNQNSTVGAEAF